MGVKSFPAAAAVRIDLGLQTLQLRRQMLKLLYYDKLCQANSNKLLSHLFRKRHSQVVAGHGKLSCLNSFKACLDEFNLSHVWLPATCPNNWPTLVRSQAQTISDHAHTSAITNSSSLYIYRQRGFRSCPRDVHPYLDDRHNIRGTRFKTYLRMGTLWTMSRVASCAGWPRAGGECLLCRSRESPFARILFHHM